jgi:S1-C subfamily serine protease
MRAAKTTVSRAFSAAILAAALLIIGGRAGGDDTGVEVYGKVRDGVVTLVAIQDAAASAMTDGGRGWYGDRILCSGVVISEDGLIMTAEHGLGDEKEFGVLLSTGEEARGEIIARESFLDLALVRVKRAGLKPIPWRTDEAAVIGEEIYAVGTPGAFADDPTPALSRGIVSAVDRSLSTQRGREGERTSWGLIETDAQMSPGESGGALVDGEGRLLGMCFARYRPRGFSRSRTYATPADRWLRRAIDALVAGERVPIGYLGARVAALGTRQARRLSVKPRSGIEIVQCDEGGPFEAAGIGPGDVIATIDGVEMRRVGVFGRTEMRLEPGRIVTVRVIRTADNGPRDTGSRSSSTWSASIAGGGCSWASLMTRRGPSLIRTTETAS